jgi:Carboxypeptidase regulatory-like domain
MRPMTNWKEHLLGLLAIGACGVCLVANGTIAHAQLQAGRIVGQVFDPQHAAVPKVTVTVTNTATNVSETVTTDQTGNYVATPLNPGTYSVSASVQGFETEVRNGIDLSVGQAAEVDLTLRIGQENTKVVVNSSETILQTQSGSLDMTVSNTQVQSLPLNGRQFTQLAELSPGVAPLPATGNTQNVRPELLNGNVFDGISGQETYFLLDGADVTAHHEGGTQIMTSIDAMQEFNVESSPYSAEYAGVGAAFNSTTKSGANQFHGDLFEFVRNQDTDAKNYFSLTKAELKRNQFGGTIGGPLGIPHLYSGRDKTFFFASYEGNRQVQGIPTTVTVPTTNEMGGNFLGAHHIYDPTTTTGGVRTEFMNDQIPGGEINSVATYFDKYIPASNLPNGTQFSANPVQYFRYDNFALRVDQVIHTNHRLFARYSTDRNRENDASPFPLLGSTYLQAPAANLEIAFTSTIGSHIVNEALYSQLLGEYRGSPLFPGQGVAMDQAAGIVSTTLAGLINPGASTFPIFNITNYLSTYFTGQFNDGRPKGQNRNMREWADNLTWEKGRHLIKTGTMIEWNQCLLFDSRTSDGSFSYTGTMTSESASVSGTGDAFADWLLGYPANATRGNYPNFWGGQGTYWHFYGQDDWRATEKLTLTLGLRYEYSPWLTPYLGQGATFDPTKTEPIIVSSNTDSVNVNAQPDAAVGLAILSGLVQTTHQAGLPITVTNVSRDQFAPRVGFAWRPFGQRVVVRGGIGQYYQIESTNVRLNFNFLPFDFTQTVNATTFVVPTQTSANFFLGQAFGAGLTPANTPLSWAPIPEHAKMAADGHWSFGIETQLPAGMVLDTNYVGSSGRHLPGTLNVNDPTPATGSIQPRRPYTNFGTINFNTQNGESIYHAFQASLHKRTSFGLWYTASYTFAKSIIRAQQVVLGGDGFMSRYIDPANVPQITTVALGYSLPFGRGQRFMSNANSFANAVLGGWQFQTIDNFRSGVPFTPTISTDVANIGVTPQHPNIVTPSGCAFTGSLAHSFVIADFTPPPAPKAGQAAALSYGNSGQDICRSQHYEEVDMSLFKEFNVTEGSKFQFRFEAFNVPNADYWAAPSNTNIDSASSGGQITATSNNSRDLQFALKYVF